MDIKQIYREETGNDVYPRTILGVGASFSNDYVKWLEEQLILSGVVKSLKVKEEIVFEDWLKQHRFTKDINDYVKNNITYREWEVFNMYTMDVYNL